MKLKLIMQAQHMIDMLRKIGTIGALAEIETLERRIEQLKGTL